MLYVFWGVLFLWSFSFAALCVASTPKGSGLPWNCYTVWTHKSSSQGISSKNLNFIPISVTLSRPRDVCLVQVWYLIWCARHRTVSFSSGWCWKNHSTTRFPGGKGLSLRYIVLMTRLAVLKRCLPTGRIITDVNLVKCRQDHNYPIPVNKRRDAKQCNKQLPEGIGWH